MQYSIDVTPMSALILAETKSDFANITGISMNANLRAVAVHRSQEQSDEDIVTLVGRSDVERKLFKIDGKGGERIVKLEVGYGALPHFLMVSLILLFQTII